MDYSKAGAGIGALLYTFRPRLCLPFSGTWHTNTSASPSVNFVHGVSFAN